MANYNTGYFKTYFTLGENKVEIFGEHLPVTVLSDILDTIPYEVLTGVSNRVKKVYYQD